MDYIKEFSSHTEYEAYINGGNALLPNVSVCQVEEDVHYNPYIHDYSQDYLTFEALQSGTFKFSGATSANTLQYSLDDGETWTTLVHDTDTPTISAGSNILWKGSGLTIDTGRGIGKFVSTGTFNVKGNIMSLLFGDDFLGQTSLEGKNDVYRNLFNRCTKLVSAENLSLPATTLADYCYSYMFYDCSGLTSAPELPSTTLASSCYDYMFYHCTSLTSAPELPATTLANNCYFYMFSGCTSLTTAPALPATTLKSYCYGYMFQGCTNLSYIKAMFTTTPSTTYTRYWVKGVKSRGTFIKNSAATWDVTGDDGIPTGWTVQTASS